MTAAITDETTKLRDRPGSGVRPAPAQPRFPAVAYAFGRGYVFRSALNLYKAELMAASLGVAAVPPPPVEPDPMVPLPAVANELGVNRRTIGRRIAEAHAEALLDR